MTLPHDTAAERSFLAVMFTKPQFLYEYAAIITPEDFYSVNNGLIYASLQRISADTTKRLSLDMIGVVRDLNERNELEKAGGSIEVSSIAGISVPAVTHSDFVEKLKQYSGIILDCSQRRTALRAFNEALARVNEGEELTGILASVQDNVSKSIAEAHGLAIPTMSNSVDEWGEWLEKTKDAGECPGVPSGIPALDKRTGGFMPGNLIILGARPSMGKTALALNFIVTACRRKRSAVFFSLEMTRRELISRIVSSEGGINAQHANVSAQMSDKEKEVALSVLNRVRDWRLFIDDSPSLSVPQMLAKARRLRQTAGLDLVVIDHLNLIAPSGRAENRTNEMRQITGSLKAMAKILNVPVLCLCQLSRGSDSRSDKHPLLSDLRESGTIEQDADCVLLLYREGYYSGDKADNSAELNVAKLRGGRVGPLAMIFDGEHQKFTEAAFADAEPQTKAEKDVVI